MFRRVNADEVALRMVKSKVNFLSKKTVPCTHQRGNVDSRRAVSCCEEHQHRPERPDKGKEMETS